MKKISILVLLCLIIISGQVFAQRYSVSATIPDFTDITAACVETTYGQTHEPFKNQGIINGRHTVITKQGTDRYTGNKLKFLPDGESKVVRLGNERTGSEAESITYHFIVDKEKSILFLKFAVVFEDPGHPHEDQPRFVVRIKNKEGELIESCAEYDVSARADIEGFQTYTYGGAIRWRDWTNVGLDMSHYAGQEVQVQFITYDCNYSGHFGYAYFTASCISNKLNLESCNGQDITIAAPSGFSSYLWNDGTTTPSISQNTGGKDRSLSCEITSATGCRFTLSATLATETTPPAESQIYYDTICEGDVYFDHDFELPPQEETGTFTYYNSYFDINNCKGNVTTTLFLTVQKRYYPIVASICQGKDYTDHHFSIIRPAPGIHHDTIRYRSRFSCDSIVTLTLHVSTNFALPDYLIGNDQVCTGSVETYILPHVEDGTESYHWETPKGYNVLSGQKTKEIKIQFTEDALPGTIILRGKNGCGEGIAKLQITPSPGYWKTPADSICIGEEYHENGFDIPAQNNAGYYTYTQNRRTAKGCDSIISLHLSVFPNPDIKIIATDSVICDGETVQLQAAASTDVIYFPPLVAVGDILCSDGKTVKPEKYIESGKTAIGVVFWVDKSGEHGWATHLNVQCIGCQWKNSDTVTPPPLPRHSTERAAFADTSGYLNTKAFGEHWNKANFPLLRFVDFNNGWYVPSISQLNIMCANIKQVNTSLKLVKGRLILGGTNYWSSTLKSQNDFWILYPPSILANKATVTAMMNLRVVRTF